MTKSVLKRAFEHSWLYSHCKHFLKDFVKIYKKIILAHYFYFAKIFLSDIMVAVMSAQERKKLSDDKDRYKYKKVLMENGNPVPGLWQRLGKFSAYISIIKDGKIVPTFVPLKAKILQKAIGECQKLQAFWAKERNNFRMHEITESALKEEVYLLSKVFTSALCALEKEAPSIYKNYLQDARNKDFLSKYKLLIDAHKAHFYAIDAPNLDLKQKVPEEIARNIIRICALDEDARESIDDIFEEAIRDFDNEGVFKKAILSETSSTEEFFGRVDLDLQYTKYCSPEKKLEGILMKRSTGVPYSPSGNLKLSDAKEKNFSDALDQLQKNRDKAEQLAFSIKSDTAFKIIQSVIYPLETEITILKALLRYCPKTGVYAGKS